MGAFVVIQLGGDAVDAGPIDCSDNGPSSLVPRLGLGTSNKHHVSRQFVGYAARVTNTADIGTRAAFPTINPN